MRDSVIRTLKYIVSICHILFFSILLYYGLDTDYNLFISIAFFIVVIVIFIVSGENLTKTNEFRSPLLLNICFLMSNLLLLYYPHLWKLTIIMSISAICDIVTWYLERLYVDKQISSILKEEIRLPPATNITLLVGLFSYASDNNLTHHPVVWIIAIVLISDVIRQILCRKHYPYSKDW